MGPPAAGLVVAVQPAGAVRLRGPMRFYLHVKSAAGAAVALPPATDAFGWMTVLQTFGEDRQTHYTARVPMPAKDWPGQVAGEAPQLAAWALLGFMVHRKTVPEAAGLESKDPKARTTAAEVLARHASDENLSALVGLLADENDRVRGVAAKMLGQSKRAEPRVLGALVKALDRPGESARERICRALSDLAGKEMPYDPSADASTRAATLAAWKAWWAGRRPK